MADNNDLMEQTISHFIENSTVKSNGIREVRKAAYLEELERHGVSEDDLKRVQHAVDHTTTAAAHVALKDLEEKISNSSAEDLKKDDYRRDLDATVRLPTAGGSTEVTVNAENVNRIPFKGEGDEPSYKTTYGRVSTTINTKGRIHKDFHDEAGKRLRAALGIKEVA